MLGEIIGAGMGLLGMAGNKSAAKQQYKQAKKFAQNSIQWRVADATKAGLHPLAALGANTMSYSPTQVGDMAGPLADMGQNVGRAIEATTNGTERMSPIMAKLGLERAGLENDLLRTQIASQNAQLMTRIGPPMPTDGGKGQVIPGQGNSLIPTKSVDPQQTTGVNVGKGIESNPYFSDAQSIEDRYGDSEILSMLSAVINGGADGYWNLLSKSKGRYKNLSYPKRARRNTGYPRSGGVR